MRTSPGPFCCPDFVFFQLCGVPQRIHRPAILLQGLQQHHLPDLHGSRRQGKFRQPAFGPVVPDQSDVGHPGPVLHGHAPPPQFRLETQRPRFQLRIRPNTGPPGIPKAAHAFHRQNQRPGSPQGFHRRPGRSVARNLPQKGQGQVQHLRPGKAAPAQPAQFCLGLHQRLPHRSLRRNRRKQTHTGHLLVSQDAICICLSSYHSAIIVAIEKTKRKGTSL